MSTKKSVLITAGSIVGFVVLVALALLTVRFINQSTNGVRVEGNDVSSAYFEATLPEGAVVTNSDSSGSVRNNIYSSVPTDFGELRISISRQNYEATKISQRGEVSSEQVIVDGVSATVDSIDYQNVVRGSADKLLIRYEVGSDKVAKPSSSEYTTFRVAAMSKRDLTSSEKKYVRDQADSIIKSLVIK